MLEVTDDSGFLALVVPAVYETFVAEDWTFDQILAHFKAQMARRSLLIWGTGLEGFWKVDVVFEQAKVEGFREVTGPLEVVGSSLLLTNYESLTMVAGSRDCTLPEKYQEDWLISLPNGNYACRIIQTFNPAEEEPVGDDIPHFVIEMREMTSEITAWKSIPWFSVDG